MLVSPSSVSGFEEFICDYIFMIQPLVHVEQPLGVVKDFAHRGKTRLKLGYFSGWVNVSIFKTLLTGAVYKIWNDCSDPVGIFQNVVKKDNFKYWL